MQGDWTGDGEEEETTQMSKSDKTGEAKGEGEKLNGAGVEPHEEAAPPAPPPPPRKDYTFAAIMGHQAGRTYFTVNVKLAVIADFLEPVDESCAPEDRAQRVLNERRVPVIADYLLKNRETYILPALTAVAEGTEADVLWEPAKPNAKYGRLTVPTAILAHVLDGQHRRAAAAFALLREKELAAEAAKGDGKGKGKGKAREGGELSSIGDDTVSVVLYLDPGLAFRQAWFADINGHAQAVSRSLAVTYDNRDPLAVMTRAVINGVPLFAGFTEMEKASASGRSTRMFAIGTIRQAVESLVNRGRLPPKTATKTAIAFWREVAANVDPWTQAQKGKILPVEVREKYICGHAVAMAAIAWVGGSILSGETTKANWQEIVGKFRDVDWSRANPAWHGRAMDGGADGQMMKSNRHIRRTATMLTHILGLEIVTEDLAHESVEERKLFLGDEIIHGSVQDDPPAAVDATPAPPPTA